MNNYFVISSLLPNLSNNRNIEQALRNFTGPYLGINWGYCYVWPDAKNKKFRAGWNRKLGTARLCRLCVQKYPHCAIASLSRWGFGVGHAGGTAGSFGIPRKLSRVVELDNFYCYIWRVEVCNSDGQPSRGCFDCPYNPPWFEYSFAVLRSKASLMQNWDAPRLSSGTQKLGCCLHKNIFTALCPGIKTQFLGFLSVSPMLTKFICECHRVRSMPLPLGRNDLT